MTLLAEFASPHAVLAAAKTAAKAGHAPLDALLPQPIAEIDEDLAPPHRVPPIGWVMVIAGAVGGIVGYAMQWFSAVVHYPILSGGRPLNSWQVFVIVPYEMTILLAATFGVLAWIFMSGLPRLHHPLFGATIVERAVQDRYVLVFPSSDELATWIETNLAPVSLYEVEA